MQEKIRQYALARGANLVGFAKASDMADAPEGFRPTDIMPTAQGLVVLAKALPEGVVTANNAAVYTAFHNQLMRDLDTLAYEVALFVEQNNALAVPIPTDDPYFYWEDDLKHGMGILSNRHAAVRAGLGELGKNSLLITPRYGNRVELVTVLTDVSFESPPQVTGLCTGCRLCIDACPPGALSGNYSIEQKPCRFHVAGKTDRGHDLHRCWQCRAVCLAGKA